MTTPKASHTPGPWRYIPLPSVGTNPSHYLIHAEYEPDGSVAEVSKRDSGLDGMPCILEEQANARLIAAAPELLDALQTLLGHAMHYASMPHAHTRAHIDVASARAAIAKATQG